MDTHKTGEKGQQSAQRANSSSVEVNNTKPKHAGGRPRKDVETRAIQDILNGTATEAARLLDKHVNRKRGYKTMKDSVLKACFFVIDHAIGKARQKIEHSGGILTYRALAEGAKALEERPRPILADVMEIANKYDRDHPETTPEPGPEPAKPEDS